MRPPRANGTTYSQLIHGLKLAGIEINRKMLADIAIRDPEAFAKIAEQGKGSIGTSLEACPKSVCPALVANQPDIMHHVLRLQR